MNPKFWMNFCVLWTMCGISDAVYVWYNSTAERTWVEAQSICRNKNMTLPLLNVTTAIQLVQKYPELDGMYLWFDGKCSWDDFNFSGLDPDYISLSDASGEENCLALECPSVEWLKCKITDTDCKNSSQLVCRAKDGGCRTGFNHYINACYSTKFFQWQQQACVDGFLDNATLSAIRLPLGSYWFGKGKYSCKTAKGEILDVIFRENSLAKEECFSFLHKALYKIISEAKDCNTRLSKFIVCETTLNSTENETDHSLGDENKYLMTTTPSLTSNYNSTSKAAMANNLSTTSEYKGTSTQGAINSESEHKETSTQQALKSELGSYIGYGIIIGVPCGVLIIAAVYFLRRCFMKKNRKANEKLMNRENLTEGMSMETIAGSSSAMGNQKTYQNFVNEDNVYELPLSSNNSYYRSPSAKNMSP